MTRLAGGVIGWENRASPTSSMNAPWSSADSDSSMRGDPMPPALSPMHTGRPSPAMAEPEPARTTTVVSSAIAIFIPGPPVVDDGEARDSIAYDAGDEEGSP